MGKGLGLVSCANRLTNAGVGKTTGAKVAHRGPMLIFRLPDSYRYSRTYAVYLFHSSLWYYGLLPSHLSTFTKATLMVNSESHVYRECDLMATST
jgi:hypothetical protein